LAIVVIAATIFLCFAYADRIERLLGPGGTDIAVRLSAFILFCLGVQILWSGGSNQAAPRIVWFSDARFSRSTRDKACRFACLVAN
jgi:hypothetical protein